MGATARGIADKVMAEAALLRNRSVKSQKSWFGESMRTIEQDCDRLLDSAERQIEAYAEKVASERAEPLRAANDALRAANDMLRAQLAAAQAKGGE